MSDCPFCSGGRVTASGAPKFSGGHSAKCPAVAISGELSDIASALEKLAKAVEKKEGDNQ